MGKVKEWEASHSTGAESVMGWQRLGDAMGEKRRWAVLQCVVVCCSVLQCVAVYCSDSVTPWARRKGGQYCSVL